VAPRPGVTPAGGAVKGGTVQLPHPPLHAATDPRTTSAANR
jgi:hypothetical protein